MIKSTLLIPTYNRHHLLQKTVKILLNTFNFHEVRIVILDGSDNLDNKKMNEKLVKNTPIEYYFYENLTFNERILKGLELTETDIVSLLDDEDLIDYDGYLECVTLLENDPQASFSHGKYLNILYEGDKVHSKETYPNTNIVDENIYSRLKSFLCPYTTPAFYAVFKKEFLKRAFEYLTEFNVSTKDFITMELIVGVVPLINGKSRGTENFYIGRNRSNTTSDSWVKQLQYSKYVAGSYPDISYEKTFDILKKVIEKEFLKLNLKLDVEIVEQIFANYIGSVLVRLYPTNLLTAKINALK